MLYFKLLMPNPPDYKIHDRRLGILLASLAILVITVAILDFTTTKETQWRPPEAQIQGLVTSIGTDNHAEVLISNSRTSFTRRVDTHYLKSALKVGNRIGVYKNLALEN
jgi:hypothetical protein